MYENPRYRSALISGTATISTQLLIAKGGLAHDGHLHTPSADSEATESNAEETTVADDAEVKTSEDINETVIQESSVTQASVSSPLSRLNIGFGESILGLIIAGPFLLRGCLKRG